MLHRLACCSRLGASCQNLRPRVPASNFGFGFCSRKSRCLSTYQVENTIFNSTIYHNTTVAYPIMAAKSGDKSPKVEKSVKKDKSDKKSKKDKSARKGKKKDYGRSNGASPVEGFLSPPRLSPSGSMSEVSSGEGDNWQCTFCKASLTAKSWRRHEETQHHPKHQWTCLSSGPRIRLPSSLSSICAFCELPDPDDDHFQRYHRIVECLSKAEQERTFGRPDHLHQHAKNFHKCEQPLSELVRDTWRKDGPGMVDSQNWTCGFCQKVLSTWDARATHIAGHFKAGLTMAQWRENRVVQSTLPTAHMNHTEQMDLDALARMGQTLPGPSN